jgi:hypothetical protein
MRGKVLEIHDMGCECDYCTMPLGEWVAAHGFTCHECRHKHVGKADGYRCFNCECAVVPDWEKGKAADAVDPHATNPGTPTTRDKGTGDDNS